MITILILTALIISAFIANFAGAAAAVDYCGEARHARPQRLSSRPRQAEKKVCLPLLRGFRHAPPGNRTVDSCLAPDRG